TLLVLDVLLLGDVAKGNREYLLAADLELRDGGIRRELLAILAKAHDRRASLTHPTGRIGALGEVRQVVAVHRAITLREQHLERRAERIVARVPAQLLGDIGSARVPLSAIDGA